MDFFLDRSIPEKLARMLDHYDQHNTIIYHDERFDAQTPDVGWLTAIAGWEPRPIVVSGDGRILKNPAEIEVLRGSAITFVLFASGWCNLRWEHYAWKAIRVWPLIAKAATTAHPSVFRVSMGGQKVEFLARTDAVGRKSARP